MAPSDMTMITGFNHVTLAVSDLEASFAFYTEVLDLRPVARWRKGAHLLAGSDWLCLSLDDDTHRGTLPGYTHLAFTVSVVDFAAVTKRLKQAAAKVWQENHSEGDSLYFLDPDGHKLEIHASDLAARIQALRSAPPEGLVVFDYSRTP
jgi:catechol 2,3-dioxygenase-like lactoylglutathione lyase family enzyme